jgi:hypothetical protein
VLNSYSSIAMLAMLCMAACTVSKPAKLVDSAVAVATGQTTVDHADQEQTTEDEKLDQQLAALETSINAPSFDSLPVGDRYRMLWGAARLAIARDQPKLGYTYLTRATKMPASEFDAESTQLNTALKLDYKADAARCLTTIARRWPEKLATFEADFIVFVVGETTHVQRRVRLPLLQALFASHWTLKWGLEPSSMWRDLTMLLLEAGHLREAVEVSLHVKDPYVLIAMRSDRRFDAVIAANAAHFDIDAEAEREFRDLQSVADDNPQSLELQSLVIAALLSRRRYEAALAVADSVALGIQSTNYPRKLYQDFEQQNSNFLNYRAVALARRSITSAFTARTNPLPTWRR